MSKNTIHQANDGIMSDLSLKPGERVVIYHTIHRANGFNKFWWGARRTANHLGIGRNTVTSAWDKMVERGWMTGEVVSGRSTTWYINRQGVVDYYVGGGISGYQGGIQKDPNTLKEDTQLIHSMNADVMASSSSMKGYDKLLSEWEIPSDFKFESDTVFDDVPWRNQREGEDNISYIAGRSEALHILKGEASC